MKKILAIILVAIMSIVLLGCGKSQIDSVASDANQVKDALQFGTTEGKKENRSEKGSISDPYTISDTISFNAYHATGYNYATSERSVDIGANIEISNIKYNSGDSYYEFEIKVIDSDSDEPLYTWDYIRAGYINQSGQSLGSSYWDANGTVISILKGYSIKAFADLREGDEPSMVTFEFYGEDGESVTYYVNVE